MSEPASATRSGPAPDPSRQRYNLGCGNRRLEGWINVDIQATDATDLVTDLTAVDLPVGSAGGFFSNAFFEHLPRGQRVPHLQSLRRALAPSGFACYLGLPDFRLIAELYLNRGPGTAGPVFDLYHAYRYTHGDPELVAPHAYFEQLHKSLFDTEELGQLLTDAAFPSYAVFNYVYPGDSVAVCLGFYATASRQPAGTLEDDARKLLAEFDGELLSATSVVFTGAKSRSPLAARAAALPEQSGVRRIARLVAMRLWQV